MCDLSLILTLGSTLLGAVGSIAQGNAAKKSADYNAKVQDMNAQLSDRRAKDAVARGATEEQNKRREVARIVGGQQLQMAANGVDIGFGSPLDTMLDTAALGELDALTIRTNAYRESYDRQVDAVNQRAGATVTRMEGKARQQAGYLDAFGTVLTGAGKAYQGYKQSRSSVGAIA